MPAVHLHYWAGAKAAAGTAEETVEAATVRGALDLVGARDERFRRVLGACSLLLDGVAAHEDDLHRPLSGAVRVEVLPPFAGGSAAGTAVQDPDTCLESRNGWPGRGEGRRSLTG